MICSTKPIAVATSKGDPVIALLDLGKTNHFVIVDGVAGRQGVEVVAVRDPDRGEQYFMTVDNFKNKFFGEAVFTSGIKKD